MKYTSEEFLRTVIITEWIWYHLLYWCAISSHLSTRIHRQAKEYTM